MPGSPIEIFAKLDGIEGESAIRGHEKETIVVSYEQGLEQQPSTPSGGGGSTGRAVFPGVRFRKPVDIGSVPLMLACAGGTRLREARFTFRRSGGAGLDFYRVTLEDVLVARVVERAGTGLQYPLLFETLTSGADGGGLLEEATLAFARIRWEYQAMRPDGSLGPPVRGGWDIAANRRL